MLDYVFNQSVALDFYRNIHRSMEHNVILIQSQDHWHDRKKVMSKYFEFTKCFSITMSFYKGTQSDTFMFFGLKKRIRPKTGKRAKVSIVDESTSIFG